MTGYRIYLSGKITGLPDENRMKFAKAKVKLKDHYRKAGTFVIDPHELDHSANPRKLWTHYMRVSLIALAQADEVAVLDDWMDSKGAIMEVLIAGILKMPVTFADSPGVAVPISDMGKVRLFAKLLLNRL